MNGIGKIPLVYCLFVFFCFFHYFLLVFCLCVTLLAPKGNSTMCMYLCMEYSFLYVSHGIDLRIKPKYENKSTLFCWFLMLRLIYKAFTLSVFQ